MRERLAIRGGPPEMPSLWGDSWGESWGESFGAPQRPAWGGSWGDSWGDSWGATESASASALEHIAPMFPGNKPKCRRDDDEIAFLLLMAEIV